MAEKTVGRFKVVEMVSKVAGLASWYLGIFKSARKITAEGFIGRRTILSAFFSILKNQVA